MYAPYAGRGEVSGAAGSPPLTAHVRADDDMDGGAAAAPRQTPERSWYRTHCIGTFSPRPAGVMSSRLYVFRKMSTPR